MLWELELKGLQENMEQICVLHVNNWLLEKLENQDKLEIQIQINK